MAATRAKCPRQQRHKCEAWARYLEGQTKSPPVFAVTLTGETIWTNPPSWWTPELWHDEEIEALDN